MKTWFVKENNLRFFITNTPPRSPTRRPPISSPCHSATRNRPSSGLTAFAPYVNRNIQNFGECQSHSSLENTRSRTSSKGKFHSSNSERECDLTPENVFSETRNENECDSTDVKIVTLPNVSTKNRFDVLGSNIELKEPVPPKPFTGPKQAESTTTSTSMTTRTSTSTPRRFAQYLAEENKPCPACSNVVTAIKCPTCMYIGLEMP